MNVTRIEPQRAEGHRCWNHFLTDNDGRQIENPRFYERALERIKVLHKNLSRKRKGSRNKEKARIKLAKAYEKLTNQKDDFLDKLSRFYIDNYDAIVVEDLNIEGMASKLAGKILDASWGKFLQMLSYKAEGAGRTYLKVDPRGTSQNIPGGFDRELRCIPADPPGRAGTARTNACGNGTPAQRPGAGRWSPGQVPSLKQEAPRESWG